LGDLFATTASITEAEAIHSIRSHLPQLPRSDPSLGDSILSVTRDHFPAKEETEDRFTRMLNELAQDREAQSRKWKEQKAEDKRKWDEQNRKWEEQTQGYRIIISAETSGWPGVGWAKARAAEPAIEAVVSVSRRAQHNDDRKTMYRRRILQSSVK